MRPSRFNVPIIGQRQALEVVHSEQVVTGYCNCDPLERVLVVMVANRPNICPKCKKMYILHPQEPSTLTFNIEVRDTPSDSTLL